ncbi:MAG: DegV family protein [Acidimicrobiales bacterium]
MIGLCTDSNSQIPPELVDRYAVAVVPLTVSIDGQDFLEGVDLDADVFYARFEEGPPPVVATAAPSPGRFVAAYETLFRAGATEILSVHIGAEISGTLNAARIGAQSSPVPVRLVDTKTASFAIACCVWEAAEAIAKGATIDEAATVAETVGTRCGNVFIVGALDLARAGGRLDPALAGLEGRGIPVLSLVGAAMTPIAYARTTEEAASAMAAHIRSSGDGLRVGISIADASAAPMWRALEDALADAPEVVDLVRYRIGPSVGAHTGPGAAGAVYYPTSMT